MEKRKSQENVAGLLGTAEGLQDTSDLEVSVSMTGYFFPAVFSCTGAGAVTGELGFPVVLVLSGGCKSESWSYLDKKVEGIGK